MGHVFREFYGSLIRRIGTRKTIGLLVFIIGVLATVASVPFCGRAFLSSPASRNGYSTGPLTLDSDICLQTRLILWTAEMPLLGDTHFYLVNHVLSLISVAIAMSKSLNLAPIYLIFAGLITEVFSSSRAFIRGSGLCHTHPKLLTRLTLCNAISILLCQTLPAIYLLQNYLFQPALVSNVGLAFFISVAFYAGFVSYMAYKLLAGEGYVSFQPARPAHFALKLRKETRHISVYSVLLGVAIASIELSSAALYELASRGTLPRRELFDLACIGLGTVISGLFGARFMNQALSVSAGPSTEQQRLSAPSSSMPPGVARRFFPGFKGISIQGAILFSAIWLGLCTVSNFKVNNRLLLSVAGVSLPIGEAIGRAGCYFAGCCGSTRKDKYPGIQLLAAALNVAIFGSKIAYLANHGASKMGEAGLAAILANGVARLMLNPLRSDAAEMMFSPSGIFASGQILLSSTMLASEKAQGANLLGPLLATIGVVLSNMVMCRIATFAWQMAATQLKKRKLEKYARVENLVYAFSFAIFMLATNSKDEVARAGRLFLQKEPLSAMSNPALLASVFASAVIPVILLN
ncbi:hypothetical protein MY11210_001564 [Beauveria gryllotalpidicola]